ALLSDLGGAVPPASLGGDGGSLRGSVAGATDTTAAAGSHAATGIVSGVGTALPPPSSAGGGGGASLVAAVSAKATDLTTANPVGAAHAVAAFPGGTEVGATAATSAPAAHTAASIADA